MLCIYLILASSLNLAAGFGGMLSLGHAAFFGLGAYAYSIASLDWNATWWEAAVLSALVPSAAALILGAAAAKLQGDQFLLATVAFQILVSTALLNWTE